MLLLRCCKKRFAEEENTRRFGNGCGRFLPVGRTCLFLVLLLLLGCCCTSTESASKGLPVQPGNNRPRFWERLKIKRNKDNSNNKGDGEDNDSTDERVRVVPTEKPARKQKPFLWRLRNPLARLTKRKKQKGDDKQRQDTFTADEEYLEEEDDEEFDSLSDEEEDEDEFAQEEDDVWSDRMEDMARKQFQSLKEQRRKFLDHIAVISTNFLKKEPEANVLSDDTNNDHSTLLHHHHHEDNQVTPQTDLALPGRHFHIVTTAALPWMTGTAVNPLLRAAYLHRRTQAINSNSEKSEELHRVILGDNADDSVNYTTTTNKLHSNTTHSNASASASYANNHTSTNQQTQRWVTLVIPWLELEEDQIELYGQVFESTQAQEDYIRNWLETDAGMPDVACPETGLQLLFYPARYHSGLRSIFAMGDICQLISDSSPNSVTDVCVLEEPEHCNWYRAPGDGWTQKFHYVVGIVHTNYKEYAAAHYSGLWTAPAIALISSAMVRAYCHQVIKLSDVLQTFATEKEATSNVHGVRSTFLEIGLEKAAASESEYTVVEPTEDGLDKNNNTTNATATPIYFIGKLLWAKGLDLLLEMQDYYKQVTGDYFPIDIYGSGPEQKAIKRAYLGRRLISKNHGNHTHHHHRHHHSNTTHRHRSRRHKKREYRDLTYTNATKIFTSKAAFKEHLQKFKESLRKDDPWRNLKESLSSAKESITSAELPSSFHEWRRQPIPATFPGRVDHASLGRHAEQYKIFVNPSVSEVLCTTTAEALAMGKFAIIPVHPSNAFFLKFPNCLAYRNKLEFAANLQWALTHEPEPLTPEVAREFTWEAATDRFMQASAVTWKQAREREKMGFTRRDERIAWFFNELGKGQKGDIIRMVLGAGPVSGQVKYLLEKENSKSQDEIELEVDVTVTGEEEDDEDEGLTQKFHQSSFVQALRATVANGLPSTTVGGRDV